MDHTRSLNRETLDGVLSEVCGFDGSWIGAASRLVCPAGEMLGSGADTVMLQDPSSNC